MDIIKWLKLKEAFYFLTLGADRKMALPVISMLIFNIAKALGWSTSISIRLLKGYCGVFICLNIIVRVFIISYILEIIPIFFLQIVLKLCLSLGSLSYSA